MGAWFVGVYGAIEMRLWLWLAASAVLTASTSVSAADCTYPIAPQSVPEGKTAPEAEMISAMSAFKQYNGDVTAYLACLDTDTTDKIRQAGGNTGTIMRIKSMQSKKHNSVVTELQSLTGRFNEQVRHFKSRN